MNPARFLIGASAIAAGVLVLVLPIAAAETPEYVSRTATVAVTASANGPGLSLHYRWRSTDGKIVDVDAPTTTWTLPPGPGLHFVYVLISNGMGGYSEYRVAVNSDKLPWSRGSVPNPEVQLLPPPSSSPQKQADFGVLFSAGYDIGAFDDAYLPGIRVYATDTAPPYARYPSTGTVTTNSRGEYLIPGLDPTHGYNISCSLDGGTSFVACDPYEGLFPEEDPFYPTDMTYVYPSNPLFPAPVIRGNFYNCDGAQDELFGVHSRGTATLLGQNQEGYFRLAGPVEIDEWQAFTLPNLTGGAAVLLRCENQKPIVLTASSIDPTYGFANGNGGSASANTVTPTVSSLTVTWNGQSIAATPPSGVLTDTYAYSYLGFKGLDTRKGACQYYKAIGAVQDCDARGHFVGAALTYNAWQRSVQIGRYALPGVPQYVADYVNKTDLNLTRHHVSISYGSQNTAAVVCNHLGPPFTPQQSDINTAVLNSVNNRNLVACVAMDYKVFPGVNNGQPFVRFLIFGPSGELLPSVNLDGYAERFVPGTCVVCHGGDGYRGKFPEDGSGSANIGSHFLPYDVGNFEFADTTGLREQDQEESIYHLNQNVLQSGPTVAEQELIAGWYRNSHVLDQSYLPASWQQPQDTSATPGSVTLQTYQDFYTHVVARTCRTCHVALAERLNYDHEWNIDAANGPTYSVSRAVCGGDTQMLRNYTMPNSQVTTDRFYDATDQLVMYFDNYLNLYGGYFQLC